MREFFSKEKWKYAFYTVSHPMDAYYEIRHRERGCLSIAVVLVMLFSFSFSINHIAAGFVVKNMNLLLVNVLTELAAVLILYFLFCIANWSVACLMEGEGRIKDIAIAIGYAMTPIIVCVNIVTIVSLFVVADEAAFYWMILAIGIAYGLLMMLMGVMQVHNYTLGKTLATIILTIVSMCIIIFIIMLFVDLIRIKINPGNTLTM